MGNKKYQVRFKYYDPKGKRREFKRIYKTEKEALKALLEFKAQTLHGSLKQLEHDKITVAQWLNTWYEVNHTKWKPSTQTLRKTTIEKHLIPLISNYKLQKLDRNTYQKVFINELLQEYKPASVKTWHNIFAIAINSAVEEEIIPRNRFSKMSFSDDTEDFVKNNYLTEKELNTFLDYAKKHENITNYTALLVLSYTGMRKGELMGLHWKNIDFENHTITIEHTRDWHGLRKPKTINSKRTIPVDTFVMKQLKLYQTWCKQELLKHGKKLNPNTLIFITKYSAEPISCIVINYTIKKIIEKTGVNTITPHGLRHTHASILLNRNENVNAIAERLGNTVDMINRIYGHLSNHSRNSLVTSFSEAIGEKNGANN